MFDRLSDRARRAMVIAGNLGQRDANNDIEVGPRLMLMGVVHAREPVLTEVLSSHGLAVDQLPEVPSDLPSVPFRGVLTHEAKAALSTAVDASDQAGASAIDTRHLLLGLLSVDEALVKRELHSLGAEIDPPMFRQELVAAG